MKKNTIGRKIRKELEMMVKIAHVDFERDIEKMPDCAITEVQSELVKNHDTPKAFAKACIKAIGEISPREAHDAITKYMKEWQLAGQTGPLWKIVYHVTGNTELHFEMILRAKSRKAALKQFDLLRGSRNHRTVDSVTKES